MPRPSLSVEELMKPRYKVIAIYPFNNHFMLNEVIELPELDDRFMLTKKEHYVIQKPLNTSGDILPVTMYVSTFNAYPHLFKKLEWWEDREEGQMPAYVKLNPKNTTGEPGVFKVMAVKKHRDGIGICHTNPPDDGPFESFVHAKYFLPATFDEYTNYINSLKQ